jgi:2'-5' RNA ligase
MAFCVVALLDRETADTVRRLWSDLRARWGLELWHPTGEPHLTLAIVGQQPPRRLEDGVAATASRWAPFPVTGAGYGVFVGHGAECPVVHLALTRTPQLSALHEEVARVVAECGGVIDGQSQPQFWRPHVTLADRGLVPRAVGELMGYLADRGPKHWTVEVNNLSIVTPDRLIACLPFGAASARSRTAP